MLQTVPDWVLMRFIAHLERVITQAGSDKSLGLKCTSATQTIAPRFRSSLGPLAFLLTTDDTFWLLATCYQLAQSVLKIGSVVAERVGQGEVGGCTPLADSAWRLLQLAVDKPWSMPGGLFMVVKELNPEFFPLEPSFSLYMPLTHHISISVQALTPKLNTSPLSALTSRPVTLTMPTH